MEKKGKDNEQGAPARVKADESMKMLFNLSKRPTLDLLNGLFGEQFSMEETEIVKQNTEFIASDISAIHADCLIRVTKGKQEKQFHVEFQTHDRSSMIVRMFEYGFRMARDNLQTGPDKLILRYPQQLVLYLERDDSIQEDISCIVEFPPYDEGSQFEYRVPVKKFWNITVEEMKEKLYALIPFHVFTARKAIAEIDADKQATSEQKKALIHEELSKVKRIIRVSQEYLLEAHRFGRLTDEDLNKMSSVMVNLNHHLYEKFMAYYATFFQEVEQMVTSLLDLKAMKQARVEAMKEGKLKGMKEGKLKGMKEAKAESVLKVLEARGLKTDSLAARVMQEQDLAKLDRWLILAATANTAQEFQSGLESSN